MIPCSIPNALIRQGDAQTDGQQRFLRQANHGSAAAFRVDEELRDNGLTRRLVGIVAPKISDALAGLEAIQVICGNISPQGDAGGDPRQGLLLLPLAVWARSEKPLSIGKINYSLFFM